MSKNIKLSGLLNWILIIIFSINLISQILGIAFNELIYLFFSILLLLSANIKIDKFFMRKLIFVLFFAAYGVVLLIVNNSGIGSVYTVLTGWVVIMAYQKVKFTQRQKLYLFIVFLLDNIFWNINSVTWYDKYIDEMRVGRTIVNPNGVGYYICFTCIFIWIMLAQKKSWKVNIFKYALTVWSVVGILNVHARMALAIFVMYYALVFVLNIKFFKKRIKSIVGLIYIAAVGLEIFFPTIYIYLYRMGFASSYLYMGIAEKGLYSGRESIWLNAFNDMTSLSNWLIGMGSKQDYWQGHALNMHNNAMHLLVVFGVIGLIVYFCFLFYFIRTEFNYKKYTDVQLKFLIFFLVLLIGGVSDTMLFYNNFMLIVFVPIGIATNNKYIKDSVQ